MDAIKSLEKILGGIVDRKDFKKINDENVRLIFDKVSDKFEDQHAKVQEGALRLINSSFVIFQQHLTDNISKLFNKVKNHNSRSFFPLLITKKVLKSLVKSLWIKFKLF